MAWPFATNRLEAHDIHKHLKMTDLILRLASRAKLKITVAIFLINDEVRMKYLQHCLLCG
jgi:hypothetical protein